MELLWEWDVEQETVHWKGLLGFLKIRKYEIAPVLSFIEKHMLKLIEDGTVWGYNIPYLLTGLDRISIQELLLPQRKITIRIIWIFIICRWMTKNSSRTHVRLGA
ncbi:MAG: hypothetical protein ACLUD0_07090 [Eubacterium ramulus]